MNDQQTQKMMNQAPIMNQPPPPTHMPQVVSQQPHLPVQSQPLMLNHCYVSNNTGNTNNINNNSSKMNPWQPLQQNPSKIGNFGSSKPRSNNNNNWKGKKIKQIVGQGSTQGYNPPMLHELQSQNRQKTRKFYPNKKKFNNNNNNKRFAPYAPRNTSSFIIRAKKSGGIASLVSPCPVTPAVLPTPMFSPSREVLGDMAKEEWGVDGYGSMKGLIRLRSGNEHEDEDDDEANGSSESDVEEHVEVERRLDHDLSRFEMIYPNCSGGSVGVGGEYKNVLENRVDDQDIHIVQLEEENLTLKERLFLMETEMADLRRRLLFLERQNGNPRSSVTVEDANEEVVENGSENESENGFDVRENKEENNNNEVVQMEEGVPSDAKEVEKQKVNRNEIVNDCTIAEEVNQRMIEEIGEEMVEEDDTENEDS